MTVIFSRTFISAFLKVVTAVHQVALKHYMFHVPRVNKMYTNF